MRRPTKLARRRARLIAAENAAVAEMTRLLGAARRRVTVLAASLVEAAAAELGVAPTKARVRRWLRRRPEWREIVTVTQTVHRDITAVSLALTEDAARMGVEPFGDLTAARALAYTPQAADELAKQLRDGSPLRRLLTAAAGEAVDDVADVLTDAVTLRVNPRATARAFRQALDGTPGVPGLSARRALTIARTEQHRAYREGARDAWGRLRRRRWVARSLRLSRRAVSTRMLLSG